MSDIEFDSLPLYTEDELVSLLKSEGYEMSEILPFLITRKEKIIIEHSKRIAEYRERSGFNLEEYIEGTTLEEDIGVKKQREYDEVCKMASQETSFAYTEEEITMYLLKFGYELSEITQILKVRKQKLIEKHEIWLRYARRTKEVKVPHMPPTAPVLPMYDSTGYIYDNMLHNTSNFEFYHPSPAFFGESRPSTFASTFLNTSSSPFYGFEVPIRTPPLPPHQPNPSFSPFLSASSPRISSPSSSSSHPPSLSHSPSFSSSHSPSSSSSTTHTRSPPLVQEHQGHPIVMPKPKAKSGGSRQIYPTWLYGRR
jgi:hypothetical protein